MEQQDLNTVYAEELKTLASKPPKEVKSVTPDQAQEDYYKNFRTNVSELSREGSQLSLAGVDRLGSVEWCLSGSHSVSAIITARTLVSLHS